MRCFLAASALVALVAAQDRNPPTRIETLLPTSTLDEVLPTQTFVDNGPVDTENACADISVEVSETYEEYAFVRADRAFACLKTVPFKASAANATVSFVKRMIEFQSTLGYLKTPPQGYVNEAVDIVAGLDTIENKVFNGDYSNEYDFEADIATLLAKSYDGHLSFDGMAFGGVFAWRRSRDFALISASRDGKEAPKIWLAKDFNSTDTEPKAVSQINGEPAAQFLEKESNMIQYHDPDVRYNAMFFQLPAENYGGFSSPSFYPGPDTTLTFEDGTEETFQNFALVLDPMSWMDISSPEDFYDMFCELSSSFFKNKKSKREIPQRLPRQLQLPKYGALPGEATVPVSYPEPAVEHSASDVPLAGFFLDTDVGTVGVLLISTFNIAMDDPADIVDEAEEFQRVIEEFIAEARNRKVSKVVIDLQANGGGLVMLGYDAYLQFFPTQDPQALSRMRSHNAANILGEALSTVPLSPTTIDYYTSPFNHRSYMNEDLVSFESWSDLASGEEHNSDSFTKLLRYNLTDPLVSSSDRFSVGIVMTGYGDRTSFRNAGDPFKPEDIVLLTDGLCASTCALFTELMVQQSGVRSIVLGGRPSTGPMQTVGGTKGSLVLTAPVINYYSAIVISEFADSLSQGREWLAQLPLVDDQMINFAAASVNAQDNIRKGIEEQGIPTQFLNDSASCRVWPTPEEVLDVGALWKRIAKTAWGNNGAMDEAACVQGSVTSREAQTGRGEGSPVTANGDQKKKGAAVGMRVPSWMGVSVGVVGLVVGMGWL
ncbi:peptidase S41 family protein-like protein [Sporormia fimetaria CBS 119925]|uniref:Peptidase S41 family protein-like protein n=1 Tax=Sporormia fimetaria CBS 119925 TaxID=1340428 RepID=A0A6A6V6E4_9PLEO|nr:peptidase S41 family protein-like protein [Sporormia fimetaria CBS 119925]